MSQLGSRPGISSSSGPGRWGQKQLEEKILGLLRGFLIELGADRALRRLSPKAPLERELGLGSLERVELLLRLERDFSVKFPDNLMSEVETVSDLARTIMEAKRYEATDAALPKVLQSTEVRPNCSTEDPDPIVSAVRVRSKSDEAPPTLDEALSQYAQQDPKRPHIHLQLENDEMRMISYGELHDESATVARGFLGHLGLRPGERVGLMLPTGRDFFFAFFGIMLAGGIPVPLYPPWSMNRIEEYARRQAKILRDAGVRLLVTFREVTNLIRMLQAQIPGLRHVITLSSLGKDSNAVNLKPASPEDIALIQYTSGSTGDPKGVVLTHSNVVANIRAIAKALEVNSKDVGVSWLPLYHDMGLIGSWLFCLYVGIPIVILSPQAFLSRPERWLWAIHRYRASLSAAPNFAYELCSRKVDPRDIAGLDLSCWRAALNGAEPIHRETLEGFAHRYRTYGFRKEALLPVYGLAESSVAVTIPPLGRHPRWDKVDRATFENSGRAKPSTANFRSKTLSFVSAGRPLVDHEVRIVSNHGIPVESRVQGHIQCRGPSTMKGYFGRPEATAAVMKDAWVNTGDLGYMADGELFVTGRVKDLIIKGGRNLYPQEVEQITSKLKGVRQGCVAAFGTTGTRHAGERMIVVAETRLSGVEERERLVTGIMERVQSQLGIPPDEILLVPPQTVPKTSSGKIRREDCRRLYLEDKLHVKPLPVWFQVARLFVGGLGQRIWTSIRRLGAGVYGAYVWIVLMGVALPCWTLLVLVPDRSGTRVGPALLRFLSKITLRLAGLNPVVSGEQNLSVMTSTVGREGVLVISNHASYLDILVLAATLPFDFCFVAKREAASWPFVGTFIRRSEYLTVDRENANQAIQDSNRISEALLGGRSVHVFPEGTFTAASGLRPFQMGAFKVATDSGSPLLPVTLNGTRQVLRDGCLFPSYGPIKVTVSPLIQPRANDWKEAVRLRDTTYAQVLRYCGEGPLDLVKAGPYREG